MGGPILKAQSSARSGNPVPATTPAVTPTQIDSEYAAVYDVTAGRWLIEKNQNDTWGYAASLAKIVTALLIVENKSGVLDSETVEVIAGDDLSDNNSELPHQTGDVLTWRELLYCIMLKSAGDSSQAAARIIGNELAGESDVTNASGRDRFVEEMNARVLESDILARSTTFTNAYVMNSDSNPTTAADMARIAAVAFSDADLRSVSGTASHSVTITGANARSVAITHTSDLVEDGDEGVVAGKTGGWTDGGLGISSFSSAHMFVSDDGHDIAVVQLEAVNDARRTEDARGLMTQLELSWGDDIGVRIKDSQVSLLLQFDEATDGASTFTDLSDNGFTVTANGNAQVDTGDSVFGDGCLLLDGVGDYLEVAPNTVFDAGSGDFTVECWIKGSDPGSNFVAWVSKWDTTGNERQWSLQWDHNNDRVVFFCSTDGSDFPSGTRDVSPASLFDGNWHHLVGVVHGDDIRVFLDGAQGTTVGTAASLYANTTTDLLVGARRSGGTGTQFPWAGRIDGVRVIKGRAAYRGPFNPLTRFFDASDGTG